jgi:L-aminopeptidase/D-esterase-like protein
VQAARVARLAMDGFTRALSPPHLDTDGDTLFCLSVGTARADVDALGRDAAALVARAIARGVRAAVAAGGLPAARDLE